MSNADTRHIETLRHVKAALGDGRIVIDPTKFADPAKGLAFLVDMLARVETAVAISAHVTPTPLELLKELKAAQRRICEHCERDEHLDECADAMDAIAAAEKQDASLRDDDGYPKGWNENKGRGLDK